MDEQRHAQILADVQAAGFRVLAEDWGVFTLTFHVASVSFSTSRKHLDAEDMLMRKWGNPPHCLATDFTTYRLTFHAND
jgi:hypothetical protein